MLKMFRIYKKGLTKDELADTPPVMLQHGLLGCSEVYVNKGKMSLGYLLAMDGFDVWMGNSRGNIYSRGHLTKQVEGDYFDFSFFEMGKYDVPANVDKIRAVTGRDKITYIGHSQGTS